LCCNVLWKFCREGNGEEEVVYEARSIAYRQNEGYNGLRFLPNFVLRWEINNAKATFARRKAESKMFNEGGFKW
ncbi:hypothetical protein PENTCL1PPCAC_24092, partial [Pristionchus entomophagus]